MPVAGSTSAAYWINRNIIYTVDYTRGIDILRYTGPGTNGPLTGANQNGTGRGYDHRQAKPPQSGRRGGGLRRPTGMTPLPRRGIRPPISRRDRPRIAACVT